jgi:hypothetical protein
LMEIVLCLKKSRILRGLVPEKY